MDTDTELLYKVADWFGWIGLAIVALAIVFVGLTIWFYGGGIGRCMHEEIYDHRLDHE